MQRDVQKQPSFVFVGPLEERIPEDHPLRAVQGMVDAALSLVPFLSYGFKGHLPFGGAACRGEIGLRYESVAVLGHDMSQVGETRRFSAGSLGKQGLEVGPR